MKEKQKIKIYMILSLMLMVYLLFSATFGTLIPKNYGKDIDGIFLFTEILVMLFGTIVIND